MNFCPVCSSTIILKVLDQRERYCCTNDSCTFIHWNNPTPVVGIIVETSAGIVLAHNKLMPEGMFSIITGFLEAGENPDEAAAREMKEELNLDCINTSLIGAYSIAKTNQVLIVYHIMAQGELILNDELDDYRIVPKEALNGWHDAGTFDVARWIMEFKVLA
jgi:NAD+ diphosphatase